MLGLVATTPVVLDSYKITYFSNLSPVSSPDLNVLDSYKITYFSNSHYHKSMKFFVLDSYKITYFSNLKFKKHNLAKSIFLL